MGFSEDVELLKSKRIIKKDKDISDKTGYKKSTVSNYLSGKVPPSKAFLEKFYEVYKNELPENKVDIQHGDLEKEIIRLKEIIAGNEKIMDAQQKALIMAERLLNSFTRKISTGIAPHKRKN